MTRELSAPPSDAMRAAALEGLRAVSEGLAGPGLRKATIRTARTIAAGRALGESWWRDCAAWHARHGAQKAERAARRRAGPARTAWLLWGGADGPVHARAVLAEMARVAGVRANPRKGEGQGPGALDGLNATEQYTALRWGLEPRKLSAVESTSSRRQALVELGRLEELHLVDVNGEARGVLRPRRPLPTLAVGAVDNRLYVVGGSTDAMAAAGDWGQPGRHNLWIRRTDYTARKGSDEPVYWYHDHENPYPRYTVTRDGRPHLDGGGYHVEPAGIVG